MDESYPWIRTLLEKLKIVGLVQVTVPFLCNFQFPYHVHSILPLDTIRRYISLNLVHDLVFHLFKIYFNIIRVRDV
jgi:predicted cobalt transporter CbtA